MYTAYGIKVDLLHTNHASNSMVFFQHRMQHRNRPCRIEDANAALQSGAADHDICRWCYCIVILIIGCRKTQPGLCCMLHSVCTDFMIALGMPCAHKEAMFSPHNIAPPSDALGL